MSPTKVELSSWLVTEEEVKAQEIFKAQEGLDLLLLTLKTEGSCARAGEWSP